MLLLARDSQKNKYLCAYHSSRNAGIIEMVKLVNVTQVDYLDSSFNSSFKHKHVKRGAMMMVMIL